jgi:orotidine-5'-phosphate decarboxylase
MELKEGRNFRSLVQAHGDEERFVCVGLDPDMSRIPSPLHTGNVADTIYNFNTQIIDATADLVCAYKPNTAFYEAYGSQGWKSLERTMSYIRRKYPRVATTIDAKRGDIGNTNNGYMSMVFDNLRADSITINPYLGAEANLPFLKWEDKGIIVLCRTSNPGAAEYQELIVEVTDEAFAEIACGQPDGGAAFDMPRRLPLYQYVAYRATMRKSHSSSKPLWNRHNNCALVVGATFPGQMKIVREIIGDDMLILAPGVDTQGGDVEATVKAARNSRGEGFVISSSSAVLYASDGKDFAQAARQKVLQLNEETCKHLS